MSPAILARGLRKTYRVHRRGPTTLKEALLVGRRAPAGAETFDALRALDLEQPRGRSLAVVGHNGSGKSTLLKLMAGVIEPDGGTIRLAGRVAALLELGAGFQPEFTGMENIFLQGSLMGLEREEILARLDDILAFCELERFIHTPLRCYSSGMVVRLGFAVAIHARPDVLLVDEVLAVGDAAFQGKCLRAIDHFREGGGTVVLVSHSPAHLERAAEDLLWLERGEARLAGPLGDVLPAYLDAQREAGARGAKAALPMGDKRRAEALAAAMGGGAAEHHHVRLLGTTILDAEGRPRTVYKPGEPFAVRVEYEVIDPLPALEVQLGWAGFVDTRVGYNGTAMQRLAVPRTPGRHAVVARLHKGLQCADGRYGITTALANPDAEHDFHDLHLLGASVYIMGGGATPSEAVLHAPGRFVAAQ